MNTTAPAQYVDTRKNLAEFLRILDDHSVIALDTEFVRERTYYSELCLIQVAAGESIWCIDPIAIDDKALLFDALNEPNRLKIFHSGRQDLEIFYNETGQIPAPLFDTQIAAALLGRPDQIGYASLVAEFYDCELDKTSSRTNWAQRPLTNRQLEYAADDVRYLEGVKRHLEQELKQRGRETWLQEECRRLGELQRYENDPATIWKRVKGVAKLEPRQINIAASIAAWRESVAQTRNLPRGWVLKDDRVISLARSEPRSVSELALVDGIAPGFVRRHGEDLIDAIRSVSSDLVSMEEFQTPKLTGAGKSLSNDLLNSLRKTADDKGVSSTLIATRGDIEAAVCGCTNIRLYEGWRYKLLGKLVQDRIATSDVRLHE